MCYLFGASCPAVLPCVPGLADDDEEVGTGEYTIPAPPPALPAPPPTRDAWVPFSIVSTELIRVY